MTPNNSLLLSTTGPTAPQGVFNQGSCTALSAYQPSHLFKQVSAAIEASAAAKASAKRTYILFVLDTSGSMVVGKELTMAAYNDQIRLIKETAAETGDTKVSLFLFNDTVTQVQDGVCIEDVIPLSHATYRPSGSTALYDGIGAAIERVISSKGFGEPDTAFLVTILTDGEENSSRHVGSQDLAQSILALEKTKTVSFSILGPKENLQKLSDVLSIRKDNVGGYSTTTQGGISAGMASMTTATSTYLRGRVAGETQVGGLYSEAPPHTAS